MANYSKSITRQWSTGNAILPDKWLKHGLLSSHQASKQKPMCVG